MDRGTAGGSGLSRRALLQRMGGAAVTLTVTTAAGPMTPRQAHAQGAPLAFFTPDEAETLGALGEVLLPGAREAGIVPFVDDQLDREQRLLILRYLDYPGDFKEFYRQGLGALDALSQDSHGQRFARLTGKRQSDLVRKMAAENPEGWEAAPAPFFYFVTRSDAIDVVYGTEDGFAKLDIPYMPHIPPQERW